MSIGIDAPKIAFLNLAGAACAAIVAEDRQAIGELFEPNVQVTTVPVRCDVLFVYCGFEPSGKVVGQTRSLRDLVRETEAQIVVIASEVPGDFIGNGQFSPALSKGDNPPVNLVITLNRNGEKFARFFRSLFELMWAGKSMPMAWVRLAPQAPGNPQQHDHPGTIFAAERGQVAFTPRPATSLWRRIGGLFGRK
jgi:hypothetical protein